MALINPPLPAYPYSAPRPAARDAGMRRNNFDVLRLTAAVSVVFSNSFLIAEGSEASEPFARLTGNQCVLGLVGVFVFFVISGYLVTGSFCRRPEPAHFAMRRMLRIYPGLALNLLVCAFVLGPLVTSLGLLEYLGSPELGEYLLRSFALTPGSPPLPGTLFADNPVGRIVNGSLWTLRYEMMMYALVLVLGVTRLLRLSTALSLTALGIVAVACERALKPFGDLGEMAWLLGFFASGMALYFLRERLPFTWLGAAVAVAALAVFARQHAFIMLFPLAGAYLAIGFATRYHHGLDYAGAVGDLSYGLYIYGWPAEALVMWLSHGRAAWWEVFCGGLVLALALAWLSWHLIEKRALRWRPRRIRIRQRRRGRATVSRQSGEGAQWPTIW
jgi:peptidoglycan/LPS O-acetylase OafA/YrhL